MYPIGVVGGGGGGAEGGGEGGRYSNVLAKVWDARWKTVTFKLKHQER